MYVHTARLFMELRPWRVKGRGICRLQPPQASPTPRRRRPGRERLIPGRAHTRCSPFDRDRRRDVAEEPPDKSLPERRIVIKSEQGLGEVRLTRLHMWLGPHKRNLRNVLDEPKDESGMRRDSLSRDCR